MKIFHRILVTSLPLIILPLLLGMLLTAVRGNGVVRDLVLRNAALELNFFQVRCEEEYEVLRNLGIGEIDFYRINAQESVLEYARQREIPGGTLFVLSDTLPPPPVDYRGDEWVSYTEYYAPWDWEIGVAVSREHLSSFFTRILKDTLVLMAILLVPLIVLSYFFSRRFSQPLVTLAETADALARGNLNARAVVPKDYELCHLAGSFNAMADHIEGLTRGLEQRVSERTEELTKVLEDLRHAQNQIVQSEKLSALGRLTAGVAHELNSPLGALLSLAGDLEATALNTLESRYAFLSSLTKDERDDYYRLLHEAYRRERRPELLVDREERNRVNESLRNLPLQERNNLIDGILTLHMQDRMDWLLSLLRQPKGEDIILQAAGEIEPLNALRIMRQSAEKAAAVVEALGDYIRTGEERTVETFELSEELEKALSLFDDSIRRGVQVTSTYTKGALLRGDRKHLRLVWKNLIENSLDAMEYQGVLTVETFMDGETVGVSIADTGKGVPAHLKDRLFEPFFTTKQTGAGMGLGLDISKRIVEKEGGDITFSCTSQGTIFTVRFPR
ncbi:MAG: HAMP domain-containing protein [Spirochaetales bacterium]|nr:HAMP domain-containing protein [Spirochaetales bacterium]